LSRSLAGPEGEEGKPVDRDVMAAAQARAVEQVVRHQAEAGIDVVSAGAHRPDLLQWREYHRGGPGWPGNHSNE
jgi:hypothetical protein